MKVFVFSQDKVLQRLWSRSSKLPCVLQRHVPAVQEVHVEGAADSVPRQIAGHSSYGAETGAHSANCTEVRGDSRGARSVRGVVDARCCRTTGVVHLVVEVPQMQFTDKIFAIPVVVVQKPWRFRSCCSSKRWSWRRGRSPRFWWYRRP